MGSAQSCIVASLSVCSVYLGYVHIYCSYKLLKTNVLDGDNLPSFLYLYIKYWSRALTRRTLDVCATPSTGDASGYTVLKCRWATCVVTFIQRWSFDVDSVRVCWKDWTRVCCGASAALRAMAGITRTPSSETSRCASRSFSVAGCCSCCSPMKASGSVRQVGYVLGPAKQRTWSNSKSFFPLAKLHRMFFWILTA